MQTLNTNFVKQSWNKITNFVKQAWKINCKFGQVQKLFGNFFKDYRINSEFRETIASKNKKKRANFVNQTWKNCEFHLSIMGKKSQVSSISCWQKIIIKKVNFINPSWIIVNFINQS